MGILVVARNESVSNEGLEPSGGLLENTSPSSGPNEVDPALRRCASLSCRCANSAFSCEYVFGLTSGVSGLGPPTPSADDGRPATGAGAGVASPALSFLPPNPHFFIASLATSLAVFARTCLSVVPRLFHAVSKV